MISLHEARPLEAANSFSKAAFSGQKVRWALDGFFPHPLKWPFKEG
jgi:hypothetical protein